MCGSAFGEYHEDEAGAAGRAGRSLDRPRLVLPEAGRRADVRHDRLRPAPADEHPRSGASASTAMSGIRIPERDFLRGRDLHGSRRQHDRSCSTSATTCSAIAYGTAAGAHTEQFGAGVYFGTSGTIDGILLNGEPFDFPGRELTAGAPPSDRNAQVRVLPHVDGAPPRHRGAARLRGRHAARRLGRASGTPTPVTAEHARHVIDIIESGYRSAEIGARQDLTTSFDLAPLST